MASGTRNLGKLVSIHGIAPVFLQRAVLIALLSFLFFLAMMFAFYIRQNVGYFLLATAFLVVYLVTMLSWVVQRRHVVRVFENGIRYRKFESQWHEIKSVTRGAEIRISTREGDQVIIPNSIEGSVDLVRLIDSRISSSNSIEK